MRCQCNTGADSDIQVVFPCWAQHSFTRSRTSTILHKAVVDLAGFGGAGVLRSMVLVKVGVAAAVAGGKWAGSLLPPSDCLGVSFGNSRTQLESTTQHDPFFRALMAHPGASSQPTGPLASPPRNHQRCRDRWPLKPSAIISGVFLIWVIRHQ